MRRSLRLVSAGSVLAVVALSACGLDVVGSRDFNVNGQDASVDTGPPSPGRDTGSGDEDTGPVGPCTTTSTTCTDALAAGWVPVAVPTSPTGTCPDHFNAVDLVKTPKAEPGACRCGKATQDVPMNCTQKSPYTGRTGGDTSCGNNVTDDYNVKPGCQPLPGPVGDVSNLANYGNFTVIQDKGTCSAPGIPDDTKISTTAVRICEPSSECTEDACRGVDQPDLHYCIAHVGNVQCPTGSPFTHPSIVAAKASLTCSPCGCENQGTCESAKIDYFTDGACQAKVATRVVDGTCRAIQVEQGQQQKASYYVYTATPKEKLVVTTDSSPGAELDSTSQRTICCR